MDGPSDPAPIVTRANALIQPIHDRMPVTWSRARTGRGSARTFTDAEGLTQLLAPFPAENIKAYPVDRWVNNPKSEGAACVSPPLDNSLAQRLLSSRITKYSSSRGLSITGSSGTSSGTLSITGAIAITAQLPKASF